MFVVLINDFINLYSKSPCDKNTILLFLGCDEASSSTVWDDESHHPANNTLAKLNKPRCENLGRVFSLV
jgi:hypothetical protein